MCPFTDLRTGSDTFLSMGHDFGYARVSTGDQDARLQHDALTAAGCYRIFTDTASGSLESRPELDKLLDQLRRLEKDCQLRSRSRWAHGCATKPCGKKGKYLSRVA